MSSAHGPASGDARVSALRELLLANGVPDASARAGGPAHEIAVIEAPLVHAPLLAQLAGRIRAIGFRYVAIDLGSDFAR